MRRPPGALGRFQVVDRVSGDRVRCANERLTATYKSARQLRTIMVCAVRGLRDSPRGCKVVDYYYDM